MTLRRRVIMIVVGALGAGLLLAGIAEYVVSDVTVRNNVNFDLQADVLLVQRAFENSQPPVLPRGEGWAIYVHGQLAASGGASLPRAIPPAGELTQVGSYYLLTLRGAGSTEVVIGESRTTAARGARALLRDLVLIDIGVLIVAGLLGSTLADRALSHLRKAAAAARNMAEEPRPRGRLPVGEAKDEVGIMVGAVNDLLDRLDRAFRELEVARERERSFVADAGHDLKTPLTIIKGNVELLTRPDLDEDARRVAVREADQAAIRMTALLDRLVLAARGEIEAGGQKETLDLRQEAEDLVARFSVRLEGRALSTELAPTPPVFADRLEIQRALDVIFDNAIRYTDAKKGEIRVSSGTRRGQAHIAIQDNGPGVDPKDRERVFERFVRLDPARAPSGYGLGLSIARTIVRATGGEITLDGRPGHGSTFTVTLPATRRTGEAGKARG